MISFFPFFAVYRFGCSPAPIRVRLTVHPRSRCSTSVMDEEVLLNSVTLLPPAKIARAWSGRCNLRAAPERHSAELQRHRWARKARKGPSRGIETAIRIAGKLGPEDRVRVELVESFSMPHGLCSRAR